MELFIYISFAVVFIIILVVSLVCSKYPKNSFVSEKAKKLYKGSKKAFQKSSSYGNFCRHVKDADPVIYTDMHRLHRSGNLNPDQVQSMLR